MLLITLMNCQSLYSALHELPVQLAQQFQGLHWAPQILAVLHLRQRYPCEQGLEIWRGPHTHTHSVIQHVRLTQSQASCGCAELASQQRRPPPPRAAPQGRTPAQPQEALTRMEQTPPLLRPRLPRRLTRRLTLLPVLRLLRQPLSLLSLLPSGKKTRYPLNPQLQGTKLAPTCGQVRLVGRGALTDFRRRGGWGCQRRCP